MNALRFAALLCAFALVGYDVPATAASRARPPSPVSANLASQSVQHGIAIGNLDPTCKPCDDFYRYANGGWLAANPIPPTQSKWSPLEALREQNRVRMREALEAALHESAPSTEAQKAADYYASCIDTRARDAAGLGPLHPYLAGIASVRSLAGIRFETAIAQNLGANAFFSTNAQIDPREPGRSIVVISQGGLGLPDRDLYLAADARSAALRDAYVSHVARYFMLAGDTPFTAAWSSRAVMTIETALARASRTRAERRDRLANYHRYTLSEAKALVPSLDLEGFFADRLAPRVELVDIEQPEFLRAVDAVMQATPASDLRAYLRYHVLARYALALSAPFVEEAQSFDAGLVGARESTPLWNRCVRAVEADLPDAIGQLYIARNFSAASRTAARVLVDAVESSFREDLGTLGWMSDATRREAIAKLDAITDKVGYPEIWRTYRSFEVDRGTYVSNVVRANLYRTRGAFAGLTRPANTTLWAISPSAANGQYAPATNDITITGAILQPPFYAQRYDEATNLGAIGALIGHELTHAFDDQGRRSDGRGALRDWWLPTDVAQFNARAACVERQFDKEYDAKLVVGEGMADLGGLEIAYRALERILAGKPHTKIDGWTPEQRFFLAFAQTHAAQERPERSRLDAIVDPHPRGRDRVLLTLSNMPEFATAFKCKATEAMLRPPAERCSLW